MPADLLYNTFVEVSRVSKKPSGNVIGVLESSEGGEGHLRSFEKVSFGFLDLEMLVLNPIMMC